jgi:quercetin dioxygenase-like cupin family protein
MKYTTLDITTPGCELRTKRIGTKLWLEEWHRLKHIQQYREGDTIMKHTIHHRFMRPGHIVFILLLSLGLCFKTTTLLAEEKGITTLMSKIMKDVSGKEGVLLTVDYPPGGSTPIHRHNAHAFVYVLEGSIVMQLKGGKPVTLTPGQTFYEGPNDIHIVSRNASNTEPAKYVVFLVKDNGAPVLIPVK